MAFQQQNNHCSNPRACCCHHQNHPSPFPPPTSSDPFLISQILHSQNPPKPTCNSPSQSYPFNPNSSPFLSSLLNRIDSLESSLCRLSSSSSYLRDAAARVIQTHFRIFLVRRSTTLGQLKQLARLKSNLAFLKSQFSVNAFLDFHHLSHNAMDLLLAVDSIQGEDKMIRDGKKSITRDIVQFLEMIDGVCLRRHQVMTRNTRSMRLAWGDKAGTGRDGRGCCMVAGGSKSRNVDNQEKKLIANLSERVETIGKMSRELDTEMVDDESEGYGDLGDGNGGSFNRIKSKYGGKDRVPINKSVAHVGGSKGQTMDSEGKTIIAKLRERVEKIGKMSRTLEAEEVVDDETEGIELVCDENGGTFNQITSKYAPINGVTINKSVAHSDGKKRVCFVDGNMIGVYNVERDELIDARDVEELVDFTKGRQDDEEEEPQSDGERSTQSSEDASSSKSY